MSEHDWLTGGMSRYVASLAGLLLVMASGCGGESSSSPTVEEPQISCESAENMTYEVVDAVSVAVSDPDGDLTIPSEGLKGQLDGIEIRMNDPDADRRFTWSPSSEMNETPLACEGTFELKVTARDGAGNVTNFSASVTPGSSEE